MALVVKIDLSQAKEGGGNFNRVHVEEGEYRLLIQNIELTTSKKSGDEMLLVTLASRSIPGGRYPFYAHTSGENAWKVRSLLTAAGKDVTGKKTLNLDFAKLIGIEVGGVLKDSEYNGRIQSEVNSLFPASDLLDDGEPEPPHAPPSTKKSETTATPVADESEEDDDEEVDLDDI